MLSDSARQSRSSRGGRRVDRRGPLARWPQHGAVSVLAALVLVVVVAALGVIDVGHLYAVRRHTQNVADLAALAGAQALGIQGNCADATSAVQSSAAGNGFPASQTPIVVCGRWAPDSTAPAHFVAQATPMNAVQVTVDQPVSYFFIAGTAQPIQASAIAESSDIGKFAVTGTLAMLSNGIVNALLNALVPGSSINLQLSDYQGLAETQVKLGDLATAVVGAASINQLLGANVTVPGLATAIVSALSGNGAANVAAGVGSSLAQIEAHVAAGAPVQLGSILKVNLADPQTAANANVSLLDLLMAVAEAQAANGQNSIDLTPALNIGLSTQALPVSLGSVSVTSQLRISEPPAIGVGEAGVNADGTPITSAYSAQIRLYLNVGANVGLSTSISGQSLSAASVGVQLPLFANVGAASAWLQSTHCAPSSDLTQSYSVIMAQPAPVQACIGADASSDFTAGEPAAPTCNQPAAVASVSLGLISALLGIGNLLSLNIGTPGKGGAYTGLMLQLAPPSAQALTFDALAGDADDYQSTPTQLGAASGSLLTQVTGQLLPSLYLSIAGVPVSAGLTSTLEPILTGIGTPLSALLGSLDGVLTPVLQLLGVQVGVATVHDISLTCSQAQLVY